MANASRPRKSSQPKTSSSTGLPARADGVDPLELYVTLVAGAENLSVNAARALLRLRRAQLAARDGAKGAIIKLELRNGSPDFLASAAASPLLGDFFSLIALELIDCFPARAAALRKLLSARRKGLDLAAMIRHPQRTEGVNEFDLTSACAWVSAKPVLESIAAGLVRHRKSPLSYSPDCPVCGGQAYARQGRRQLCASCETRWPAGAAAHLPEIESDLEAFDARSLVALVRNLEQSPTSAA